MIEAALASLLLFGASPGTAGKVEVPGKAELRDLDKIDANGLLAAATALTMDRSLDDAQRVIDKGRARFPASQGFHLKQGDLFLIRGRVADAFYEYQWELMRAGKNDTGGAAAKAIAGIFTDGARGAEVDEIKKVLVAQSQLGFKSREPLTTLKKVQELRGSPFALRMLIAEAHVVAGELDAAESTFRALINEDKYFVPAYVELAGVLRLKGRTKDADALDAKARAIYPEHPSFTAPDKLVRPQP